MTHSIDTDDVAELSGTAGLDTGERVFEYGGQCGLDT
jgi:hypothetical protein